MFKFRKKARKANHEEIKVNFVDINKCDEKFQEFARLACEQADKAWAQHMAKEVER